MSKLEKISIQYRKNLVSKNIYNNNNNYSNSHPNALSDGDERGKGENNNSVGSATDIKSRKTLLTKNKYGKNKEYNDATA